MRISLDTFYSQDFLYCTHNPRVSLFASYFYSFLVSVEVSKGSRKAATFIMLTVVEGNPPKVWMGEANKKVLAFERVSLEGFYKTSVRPVKVEWTCLAEAGKSCLDR